MPLYALHCEVVCFPQLLFFLSPRHCERATRSVTTAAIPIIRTTDKQNLLPLHTVIAENLSAAISFAPIRPSLRESNAKRYDRGNPRHKNDRQTKSFAFTRCYCRKKPTGAISLALYARHCERATRSVTNAAIPFIRTTDKLFCLFGSKCSDTFFRTLPRYPP